MADKPTCNHGKYFPTLVFASIFLISLGVTHNVFAMGPPPGSCSNEYDGTYTNATLIVGNQTYYPLKNNVIFQLTVGQSYYLTTTIHVPNQSTLGNSLSGSLWYSSNAIGYDQNYCSGTVNPNDNYTISSNFGFPSDYNPNVNNTISVYWAPHGFSYTVDWMAKKCQCSAPQNLQATVGNSQIMLSWFAPTNNGGSAITNYNVYRGTSSGSETLLAVDGNVTSYRDTTVTNGQTYFYKITAVNSVGESSPSNEVNATPMASTTVPSTPTGLTATAASSQINLSWTAPSNNGGSAITGYDVDRSTNNGNTWSTVTSNTGSTSTAYNDTGLSPTTSYTYRVSAINSAGTSSPSNISSATTGTVTTNGIKLDNVQSTSGSTSTSNPIMLADFNVGTGNNRLLVVGVSADNSNVGSITFGGVSLTKKVSSFHNNDAEFWYLVNPTGTGAIVVTMKGTTSAIVGAYSFSGVNQSSPLPTSIANYNSAASSPTVSITAKFGNDFILDLTSIYGGVTLGASTGTQQWNTHMPGAITGGSSSKVVPTSGAVTCKWTASSGDLWDDVALEIGAASK